MRERIQLPLSMWRLHFELFGGQRRLLAISIAYCGVFVLGLFSTRKFLSEIPLSTFVSYVLYLLAGIQVFVLYMGGCNAIYRAMLRDYDTKMIESHRLTPMTNMAVALGYLFGAPQQMLVVFGLTFCLGGIVSGVGNLPIGDWVLGNLFMLNGAITLWAMVTCWGLQTAKPTSPLAIIIVAATVGNAAMLSMPVIALMISAYPAVLGFSIMTGSITPPLPAMVLIGAVNLILSWFWLTTAAVKYRRPDLPALNGLRGLFLVLLTVTIGTLGSVALGKMSILPGRIAISTDMLPAQWIATMIFTLLAVLIPLSGAADCEALRKSGATLRGWSDRLSTGLVAVVAPLLIFLVMCGLGVPLWMDVLPFGDDSTLWVADAVRVWTHTLIAMLLGVFMARGVFMVGRRLKLSKPAVVAVILILWAGPPLVDAIRAHFAGDVLDPITYSMLMTASPPGALTVAWTQTSAPLAPGLSMQAGLVLMLSLVGYFLGRSPGPPRRKPTV